MPMQPLTHAGNGTVKPDLALTIVKLNAAAYCSHL